MKANADMSAVNVKRPFFTARIISLLIILAPLALVIWGEASGETCVFAMLMISAPIVLGMVAQIDKGRTGVVWFMLSVIVMIAVNLMAGGGNSSHVLTRVFLFGIVPMAVVIWTLPDRR